MNELVSGRVLIDLNIVDETVGSLLHYAVILSNDETNQSSRVNDENEPGKRRKVDKKEPCQLQMVSNLVDIDQCEVNIVNKLGQTPLHMCKNVETARVLLDKGASMSIRECTGKVPLFTCICAAQFDMCVEMLKRGCDLDNVDRFGNSLLYALLLNGNAPVKLIALLLEVGLLSKDKKADWLQKRQYPNKMFVFHYLITKNYRLFTK